MSENLERYRALLKRTTDAKGHHRFSVRADNGKTISCSSEGYVDAADREHAIGLTIAALLEDMGPYGMRTMWGYVQDEVVIESLKENLKEIDSQLSAIMANGEELMRPVMGSDDRDMAIERLTGARIFIDWRIKDLQSNDAEGEDDS